MDLREFVLERKYELTLLLCVISYTIIFTYFTYQKHISFNSFAWDLGIFDQVFYSTVFSGRPFYYTPELYLNPTGNYLAIHFSPILLLLFPLYALIPSVWTLLFSKCLILSLAAFPLFYISRNLTGDERTSLFISTAYLLNPGLHGANWFDFQPQIFIPLAHRRKVAPLYRIVPTDTRDSRTRLLHPDRVTPRPSIILSDSETE